MTAKWVLIFTSSSNQPLQDTNIFLKFSWSFAAKWSYTYHTLDNSHVSHIFKKNSNPATLVLISLIVCGLNSELADHVSWWIIVVVQ